MASPGDLPGGEAEKNGRLPLALFFIGAHTKVALSPTRAGTSGVGVLNLNVLEDPSGAWTVTVWTAAVGGVADSLSKDLAAEMRGLGLWIWTASELDVRTLPLNTSYSYLL